VGFWNFGGLFFVHGSKITPTSATRPRDSERAVRLTGLKRRFILANEHMICVSVCGNSIGKVYHAYAL
jgi:hypothetical protein